MATIRARIRKVRSLLWPIARKSFRICNGERITQLETQKNFRNLFKSFLSRTRGGVVREC